MTSLNVLLLLILLSLPVSAASVVGAPGVEITSEQFIKDGIQDGPTNIIVWRISPAGTRLDISTNLSIITLASNGTRIELYHWTKQFTRRSAAGKDNHPSLAPVFTSTNFITVGTNNLEGVSWSLLEQRGTVYMVDLATVYPSIEKRQLPTAQELQPNMPVGSLVGSNRLVLRTESQMPVPTSFAPPESLIRTLVSQLVGILQTNSSSSLLEIPEDYREVDMPPNIAVAPPPLLEGQRPFTREEMMQRALRFKQGLPVLNRAVTPQRPGNMLLLRETVGPKQQP